MAPPAPSTNQGDAMNHRDADYEIGYRDGYDDGRRSIFGSSLRVTLFWAAFGIVCWHLAGALT